MHSDTNPKFSTCVNQNNATLNKV